MEASRLRTFFKNAPSISSLQGLCHFSSSSPATTSRVRKFFVDDDDDPQGGSAAYRHALKFQRPTTIEWRETLVNLVRFIGTVDRPPKAINSETRPFGVYTLLNVKPSRESNRSFRILLMMWDEMAEISIKYLKPNDVIYVAGNLGSYMKVDENGELRTNYKVTVNEINYVAQCGRSLTCKQSAELRGQDSVESILKRYKNRLHLWQLFFANPHEWWDNRSCKLTPNSPDFRHKDTGEVLWLCSNDPPWIKRQLELHDSRLMDESYGGGSRPRSRVSHWVYDE